VASPQIPNYQLPITKLLIANRGEIAVRIIRACRELGIATVAVHSEADANALHVRLADEAVGIGAAPARESYLQGQRIIEAARECGASAIHPGYGFLAENADFAQAVLDAGLIFIGPPPAAMRAMGDKAHARALMEQSGVPVVPGYQGEAQDAETLAAEATRIGYPVLVKAAAGGGGKGMRIAHGVSDLGEAVSSAQREAQHAFGDARLILERYLPEARHIEFQILGDQHGNTIHLNERECSVQRRHQKIIEETPSPLLTPALRAEMGAAAVAAAQAVGYTNAGTVEFIVDPATREYFFLEMNTRIQVEHPITELVMGVDLVQWQIYIAGGVSLMEEEKEKRREGEKEESSTSSPLPLFTSSPFPLFPSSPKGHAIECRLYAEDPASGFLPAAGRIVKFEPPTGPGVRVDTGIVSGDEITTHYDPMIAKIIVHAADRGAAIRRMQAALQETVLVGVTTNLEFLQAVLAHPVFAAGEATTRFIEKHLEGWQPEETTVPEIPDRRPPTAVPGPHTPWNTLTGFRVGVHRRRGEAFATQRTGEKGESWANASPLSGRRKSRGDSAPPPSTSSGRVLHAPMPGQVRAVQSAAGQSVKKGDTILILEAMKMEIRIQAPKDGVLTNIAVQVGEQVEKEQVLATMA